MDQQLIRYLIEADNRILSYAQSGDMRSAARLEEQRNRNLSLKGFEPVLFPVGYFNNQNNQQQFCQPLPPAGHYNNNPAPSFINNYAPSVVDYGSSSFTAMGKHGTPKQVKKIEVKKDETPVSDKKPDTSSSVSNNNDETSLLPLNKIPYEYITANGITAVKKINGGYYEMEFKGIIKNEIYKYHLTNIELKDNHMYVPQMLKILNSKSETKNNIYRINTHKKYLCYNDVNPSVDHVSGLDEMLEWCGNRPCELIDAINYIINHEMDNVYDFRVIYTESSYSHFTDIKSFIRSLDQATDGEKMSSSDKRLISTIKSVIDKFFSIAKVVKSNIPTEGFSSISNNLFELIFPVTNYFIHHDYILNDFRMKDGNGLTEKTYAINEYSHEVLYNMLTENEANDSLFTYITVDDVDKTTKSFRVLKNGDTFILNQEE